MHKGAQSDPKFFMQKCLLDTRDGTILSTLTVIKYTLKAE